MAHSHGTVPPVSRRAARLVAAVLIPLAVLTALGLLLLWPPPAPQDPQAAGANGTRVGAVVTAVQEQDCPPEDEAGRCGIAAATLDSGTDVTFPLPRTARLSAGDEVTLDEVVEETSGAAVYAYSDHRRTESMVWLVALAAAAVLAFGRLRGLTSLLGLGFSFAVLILFVIPAILDGAPPLLIAITGAAAIMFGALYLTHGVSVHTSVAVAGTLASLVLTGLLGALFTATMHLTGVGSEDTSYLAVTREGLDLRGLLLAGIVIGALGVLDDVTVTQAVTVAELSAGARDRRELYRSAIRVGRAHVGSAVNTIVLAYAGTSLPLLLLVAVSPQPLTDMLTGEFLAQEVLRAAVGTIGLVASVPITTLLAVLVADRGAGTTVRADRYA